MDIQILAHKFYDYSNYIRGYSKETIKRYRQIINFYCNYTKITNIEQVTEENVRALFVYGRTERHWKPNTFILHNVSLTVFFRWCIKEGYMEKNPREGLEVPKVEKRLPPNKMH